ncbi:MAG TPA: START domain-containing protein [Chitinophagaceae bacterium]|nr:START domain-containing protein [Chitinophagaceae bacterium]
MKLNIFIAVVCSMLPVALPAQSWELSKNENNIKVYKASSDSSRFKIIKVEAEMEGTLKKLIAVLKDVGNNKNWVYNTKRSHLVKSINENELLYYAETQLPWPFDNRDMVIRMHFDLDEARNILNVKATGEPGAAPEVRGKVRVPKFIGNWNVKYDGANKISIVYFLEVNPGGNISPGISNLFATKGPYETFNNLAKQLKK